MTVKKQEQIQKQASLYYGVFPTEERNRNHNIIIEVCELLKRIQEYKGSVRGANALPQSLLGVKYTEFWDKLEEAKAEADITSLAGKEAIKAVEDAEDLLNWIFLAA